jgi:methylenetetrahydrofolate dehydrogenase (NADP+)/methenyltetrahydrofolate cyclohydrolase
MNNTPTTTAAIVDGNAIAEKLTAALKEQARLSKKKACFILVGDNPASKKFVERKTKKAKELGIITDALCLKDVTTDGLIAIIRRLQASFDGIVVQLPLPQDINTDKVLASIPVDSDIDVLNPENKTSMVPPVANAVFEILSCYDVDLHNKNIVVVGNGRLVGAPVAKEFSKRGFAPSLVDINTSAEEKAALLANADIIVSGVGKAHMIKPDMIKEGVVLIDAGASELSGQLAGDIDPACADKAALLSPVPGGVGPLTVISLFMNLVK